MKDPHVFTTRLFPLQPDQTAFKDADRSRYIKFGPKACGVIQRPRPWLGEVHWVIKLWVYPPNVDGFDSGKENMVQLDKKFTSSIAAIKFLKKNTTRLVTEHNLCLARTNPWELNYGILK